jgi:hypothetical protein
MDMVTTHPSAFGGAPTFAQASAYAKASTYALRASVDKSAGKLGRHGGWI